MYAFFNVCMHLGITAKQLKFGICSIRMRVSIIKQCGHGNGCSFTVATPRVSYFGCKKLIRDQSGNKLVCGLQVLGEELLNTCVSWP